MDNHINQLKKGSVAIIIPIYNGEKTLRRCLDSVFSQKDVDYCVYLVVQESSDKSLDIAYYYHNNHNHSVVIETPKNSGVSYNRNQALSIIEEEYVVFIDCDDCYTNDLSIKTMVDNTKCGFQMVCGNRIKNIDGITQLAHKSTSMDIEVNNLFSISNSYRLQLIDSTQAKLYLSSIIINNNLFFPEDINVGEDNFFNYSYLAKSLKVSIVPNIIVNDFEDNKESLTRKVDLQKDNYFISFYAGIVHRVPKEWCFFIWQEQFWNIVQHYKKIKKITSFKLLYNKVRKMRRLFWKIAPKQYRKRIVSKRRFVLEFNLIFIFVISL